MDVDQLMSTIRLFIIFCLVAPGLLVVCKGLRSATLNAAAAVKLMAPMLHRH
jgi:hypothetical protein